jgi:hypothetical protein
MRPATPEDAGQVQENCGGSEENTDGESPGPSDIGAKRLETADLVRISEQDAQNVNFAAFCCCKPQTIL